MLSKNMYLFSLLAPIIIVYILSFLDYNSFSKIELKRIIIEFLKGITSFIPALLYFLIFVKSSALTYSLSNIFLNVFFNIAIVPYILFIIWFVLMHGKETRNYSRDFNSFLIHGLGFIFFFAFFNIFKFQNQANFFILFAKPLLDIILIYFFAFFLSEAYFKGKNIYLEILMFIGLVVLFAFIYVISFLNHDLISLILVAVIFSAFIFIKYKLKIFATKKY